MVVYYSVSDRQTDGVGQSKMQGEKSTVISNDADDELSVVVVVVVIGWPLPC